MDRTVVKILLDKAANAEDAAKAINYAQAACNAANALRVLVDIDREGFKDVKAD